MKHKRILLSVAMVALFGTMLPRHAEARVSFSFFYENLAPYGEWVDVGDYGYCWRPTGVSADWRPYTDGYWVYTDAGWTWVSYEDYGSITYHYGRWTNVDDVGWVWVPDYEWGPAWVSWRHSDSYIGWAPLPPEAHFSFSVGFSSWVDRDYDIGPRFYSFCDVHHFGDPVLANVIVPPEQNVTIINKTTNITNITVNNINNSTVVYNGGPDFNTVSRQSAHPIQALRLQRQTEIAATGGAQRLAAHTVGNQLVVPAPQIEKPAQPIAPPKVAKVIKQPKIEHGWAGIAPAQRQQIQQKVKQETKGLTQQSAPAHPVNAKKLATILPASADPQGTPAGMRKGAAEAVPQQPQAPATSQAATGQQKGKGKNRLEPFAPGQNAVPGAAAPATQAPAQAGPVATPPQGKKGKHGAPVAAQPGTEQVPAAAAAEQATKQQQQAAAAEARHQRQAEQQQAAEAAKAQKQQQAAEAAQARQEQQAEAKRAHQAELQQQRAATEAAQAKQQEHAAAAAEARAQHQAEAQQQRAAAAAEARQQQQAEARAQHQAEAQQQRAAVAAEARQQQQAEARAQRQAEAQQQRAAAAAEARQQQQAEARAQRQAEAQQQRAAAAAQARQQQQAEARAQQARQQQQAEARAHQGGGGRGQQGEDPRKKHKDDQNQ